MNTTGQNSSTVTTTTIATPSASLAIATPVANVIILNGGLGSLSGMSGTATVTAGKTGNTVELSVTAGSRTVESIPRDVALTVPVSYTIPGTVAVLVHDNDAREVVRKSVADNSNTIQFSPG